MSLRSWAKRRGASKEPFHVAYGHRNQVQSRDERLGRPVHGPSMLFGNRAHQISKLLRDTLLNPAGHTEWRLYRGAQKRKKSLLAMVIRRTERDSSAVLMFCLKRRRIHVNKVFVVVAVNAGDELTVLGRKIPIPDSEGRV